MTDAERDAALAAVTVIGKSCKAILDLPRESIEMGLLKIIVEYRRLHAKSGELSMPDTEEARFILNDLNQHFLANVMLTWMMIGGHAVPVVQRNKESGDRVTWKYTEEGKQFINALHSNLPFEFAPTAPNCMGTGE